MFWKSICQNVPERFPLKYFWKINVKMSQDSLCQSATERYFAKRFLNVLAEMFTQHLFWNIFEGLPLRCFGNALTEMFGRCICQNFSRTFSHTQSYINVFISFIFCWKYVSKIHSWNAILWTHFPKIQTF